MHGHYVVTEQGLPLGIHGADIIVRDDEDFRKAANRRNLPIEEKESHRWIEGYQVFFRILKTGCRVERVQLKTCEALIRALMIDLVIAWHALIGK